MNKYEKRHEVEKKVVRHLIRAMREGGWTLSTVNDGEEEHKVNTEAAALEHVFSVDEAWMAFRKGMRKCVFFFVMGNDDGTTVIADYTIPQGENVEEIMEGVDSWIDTLEN